MTVAKSPSHEHATANLPAFRVQKGSAISTVGLIIVGHCLLSLERGRRDQRFGLVCFDVVLQDLSIQSL